MSSLLFSAIKSGVFAGCSRHYAVKSTTGGSLMSLGKGKKGGKSGPTLEKVVLPVETDPEKLVNYVCGSNIYTTGEDIKLKADSEYPDWLWGLRTSKPLTLDEMDPSTKEYWIKVRTIGMRRNNKMLKFKKFK